MKIQKKETGVILLPEVKQEEGFAKRGLSLLVLLFYFYLGIYGCVYGFLSIFPTEPKEPFLFLGIFAIGIFYLLIYLTGRYMLIAAVLSLLAYGWILYENFSYFQQGGSAITNVISQVLNAYGTEAVTIQALGDPTQVAACLLAVAFLWAGALCFGMLVRGGRSISLLSVGVILSVGLAVGRVPAFWPMCLMTFYLMGSYAAGGIGSREGQKKGAAAAGIIALLLLACGSAFLTPALKPLFREEAKIRERIQKTSLVQELTRHLPKLDSSWATAGIGNGELGNTDFLTNTGEIVLEVSANAMPEENVYLKCYTGARYTGKAWEQIDDQEDADVKKRYFDRIREAAQYYGMASPQVLSIQQRDGAGDYDYQPYFSILEESGDDKHNYGYYPRKSVISWYWDGMLDTQSEESYRSFVYENYLSYPEDLLSRLESQCLANPQDSVADIESYIVNFLHQDAAYSLQAGQTPEGEDFTEYFLYEKKEGYCVHFATAATLMFRMYGIPARYVTGYVASAGDFQPSSQGYTANVADGRAHAWTEIYISGQGWIPVEATPGYAQGGLEAAESEENPEEMTGETKAAQESQKQTGQNPAGGQGGAGIRKETQGSLGLWAVICLWTVLAVAAGIGVICLRRMWMLQKRRKQGVKEIFRDVCAVLSMAGLPKDLECDDEEFARTAGERFEWLEEEAFVRLTDLALRANFDREPMTREETLFARKLYRSICGNVYKELSGVKRLVFRYLYVYI